KAIALDPKFTIAYNGRGIVYLSKGDHDSAIADFDRAIALDPKFAVAYWGRGVVSLARKDFAAALTDLSRYFDLGGAEADAYRKRAETYENLGDKDRADADYDKAAALELAAKGASGWLGAELESLSKDAAKSLGWSSPRGALIIRVAADSPAAT